MAGVVVLALHWRRDRELLTSTLPLPFLAASSEGNEDVGAVCADSLKPSRDVHGSMEDVNDGAILVVARGGRLCWWREIASYRVASLLSYSTALPVLFSYLNSSSWRGHCHTRLASKRNLTASWHGPTVLGGGRLAGTHMNIIVPVPTWGTPTSSGGSGPNPGLILSEAAAYLDVS